MCKAGIFSKQRYYQLSWLVTDQNKHKLPVRDGTKPYLSIMLLPELTMLSGAGFQELGEIIDRLDAQGLTVQDVDARNGTLVERGTICVEITTSLDFLDSLVGDSGTVVTGGEDGEEPVHIFTVEIPTDRGAFDQERREEVDSDGPDSGEGSREDAAAGDEDGAKVAGSDEAHADPEDTTLSAGEDDERNGESEDEIPYHKDRERLAKVYEEHDTFAEMTEALGVDVTPATVRQHMVNWGIHPDSTAEADDQNSEDVSDELDGEDFRERIQADGCGLPDDLTVEELVEVVADAHTLYEARTGLGLDTGTTRELLDELDLLNMVTSRMATKDRLSVSAEAVRERILAASGS